MDLKLKNRLALVSGSTADGGTIKSAFQRTEI
jgi:hypothetical protein